LSIISTRELLLGLLRERRGATILLVAIAFPALIGLAALGAETGLWYAMKRQDQSAADAAALAGAYEIAAGQTDGQSSVYANICAKVQSAATANGFSFQSYSCPTSSPGCTNPSSGQMCANNPPVSGSSNNDSNAVEVILDRQQPTFLAQLFLNNVSIDTRAVAKVNDAGMTCDLALGTTGTDITVQGSATINLTGCGMAANSSSSSAISFGGGNNDILNASWFQTAGNYNSGGNPQINVPTKLTYSSKVQDPYQCNPPQMGCAGKITYSWPTGVTNGCSSVTTGTTTLKPGLYGDSKSGSGCSNNKGSSSPPMSFTGGTATLCPGVYYLDGEDGKGNAFLVQGGTLQMGTAGSGGCPSGSDGVTIIASSKNGTKGGGFQIKSGTVTLSAPTAAYPSGCTVGSSNPCIPSGLLFYQDASYADTSKSGSGLSGDSTLTANAGTSLQGAMYTPATNVTFTGNAGSTCFLVIALTVTFTGNSTMAGNETNCKAIGVAGPTVLNIALSE
jgi:Flp pilus assembly protein TadG